MDIYASSTADVVFCTCLGNCSHAHITGNALCVHTALELLPSFRENGRALSLA